MSKQKMYKLPNRLFGEEGSEDKTTWFSVIAQRLRLVTSGNEGFNLSVMRKRNSILDKIEKSEIGEEAFFTEDEYSEIKSVTRDKWNVFTDKTLEFLEFIDGAKLEDVDIKGKK